MSRSEPEEGLSWERVEAMIAPGLDPVKVSYAVETLHERLYQLRRRGYGYGFALIPEHIGDGLAYWYVVTVGGEAFRLTRSVVEHPAGLGQLVCLWNGVRECRFSISDDCDRFGAFDPLPAFHLHARVTGPAAVIASHEEVGREFVAYQLSSPLHFVLDRRPPSWPR